MDVQTTKSFKKLSSLEFACENDAQEAADHWVKNHPWYQYNQFTIITASRKVEVKRGRPGKTDEPLIIY
jgi:transposase